MRNNVLLEFTSDNNNLLDRLEKVCKSNELFLVEWQRQNNKIRILSTQSEIRSLIYDEFLQKELDQISFINIPMEAIQQ